MGKKKKKFNDYSTDPEWEYDDNPFAALQSTDMKSEKLHVQYERKGRGGKDVTIIYGWKSDEDSLEDLCRKLKKSIGTGGSVKDKEAILQGKHVESVIKKLKKMGYKHVVG